MQRDIKLGTWKVRSLYRSGSLTAVARELAGYKFVLVGYVGQIGHTKSGGFYIFLWKRKENHQLGSGFWTPQNSINS
jgi:hypothetical protein